MVYLGGLAMHQFLGALDVAAEAGGDALVAEADSQNGNGGAELPDHIARDPGLGRITRSGRDNDAGGAQRGHLTQDSSSLRRTATSAPSTESN
jgi:hypothetical protein